MATEASGCINTPLGKVCSPDRGSSLADAMDYASYLTELAKVIKDKPALLAYDLYNEPFWLIWDNGRNMDKKKDSVCQYVSLWYDAINGEDPNHLVTLGGTDFNDVLYWDTGVMKIDFVSVHTYPYPDDNNITPANSAILREDIINQFHFYTEALGKPWIIGETGFSASDETCLANKIWGDEADQVNYFSEILSAVRDCGGSGFSWWLFQDIHWYCVDNTVCTPTCSYCRICDNNDPLSVVGDIDQNYFGLQKYTDPDPLTGQYSTADLKSAAQVSIDFDEGNGVPALAPCDAPTSFYYDPSHFSTLNTNTSTYLTGRIEDQDGNAISSAVIIAQNWLYTIDPTPLPDDEERHHQYIHTFSNDNTLGNNFTVIPYTPFNPNDPRIVYLKASAVGASKVELGGWGSDVAMNQNVGAIILDKMTLDYDSQIDNVVISTSSLKTDYLAWNSLKITNATINSGVTSELVARNEISIMPNFNAEYGSDVHIYLYETFSDCDDYTGFLRMTGPDADNSQSTLTSNQKQIKLSFQKSISKLNIKPNPSSGKYSVKIDSETDIKTMNLIIRNTLGEEMIKKEFAGFEYEIDLSNFINGIYFLELFNNEQKFNEILVKN
ncbi:MAG: cellulase family glycosylhydrolase [Bacteroidetes bacterium]|nr:cellulase family glycosylhydrolase [Bacteroidota bacterium]